MANALAIGLRRVIGGGVRRHPFSTGFTVAGVVSVVSFLTCVRAFGYRMSDAFIEIHLPAVFSLRDNAVPPGLLRAFREGGDSLQVVGSLAHLPIMLGVLALPQLLSASIGGFLGWAMSSRYFRAHGVRADATDRIAIHDHDRAE
ncbi:hypothetical protein ElP_17800 [Tautonia plasticadhaerens]|uniref:DUF2062 domain-containing protein n=2 Tax=Tautonia plasticadhaerens TaxID=2527974 RepID=A0A518GZ86_9BACT|nr:hypothetical protein ElP_17800 [Tautonia plasticadhaerens]